MYFNSKPQLNKKNLKAESFLNYLNNNETIEPIKEDACIVQNGNGIKVLIHNDLKEVFNNWINKK